jgi:DNA modification methylase
MKNNILHRISLILAICLIGFIAGYSMLIDYQFPESQMNYIFSLFYLILTLNFLGRDATLLNLRERFKMVLSDTQSIIISCLLAIIFSLLLIQTKVAIGKIFIIVILSLLFYYTLILILSRKVNLILFWINFYLFMGVFVFSQLPNFQINMISKFNPFGGLLLTLFIQS